MMKNKNGCKNKNIVMVVSPHPDDETLGMGGTLMKYSSSGHRICWLNITNMKNEYGYERSVVNRRKAEIEKVCNSYQIEDYFDLQLEPAGLDKFPLSEVIKKISNVFNKVKPNAVYLPYSNDAHSDHIIVFNAAYSCTKIFRYNHIKKIFAMEIISETDFGYGTPFSPNYFVDITDHLKDKIEIMKIYNSELGKHPFPRSADSIKSLAMLRGIQANCMYAEAFKTIKYIED